MLTLQINDELETTLCALIEREHTTPELLLQKLINHYIATNKEDFFSSAGLWQDCDITQDSLREQAWRK